MKEDLEVQRQGGRVLVSPFPPPPPPMFFHIWYALWPFQGMLPLVLGPCIVFIMSMELLICRISHKPLVSMFIPPPLPVPPSDRSVGLPYIPNSLHTRVEGLWWCAKGIECAEMMGKTSGKSYVPSPPSDVFWLFGMPYGRYKACYISFYIPILYISNPRCAGGVTWLW